MLNTYRKKQILNSTEAKQGAVRFRKALITGKLMMDVLPNSYDEFYGEKEEQDYVSYCSFLKSGNGKKVITMLEELDGQRIC